MPTTIQDRIFRIEELAQRARINLDLWTALQLDTALAGFDEALDEFDDFWRFTRSAHQSMFFIRITNLFVRDKRTENFPCLIDDARKADCITIEEEKSCFLKIDELGDLPKRVAVIRNNAIAHQHRTLKQNETFTKANISLNLMHDYSDTALEVAAMLRNAVGGKPVPVDVKPAKTLKDLLKYLEQKLTERRMQM